MSDEKKKSKLADDPNPQLPPPPLSRARLAAKIEKVFEESLPVPIKAAGRRNPISEEEVKQRFADAAARGAKIIVSKALRAQKGAKIEKVFEESLPSTKMPKSEPVIKQPIEKAIKSGVDGERVIKRCGRPPGKKPPKTLAERQQAFRDRKRGKKP